MHKKHIILLLSVAVFGSIAFAVFRSSDVSKKSSVPEQTGTTIPQRVGSPNPAEQLPTGAYIQYSDTAVAAAEGQKVLFFHAPWCSQCRSIESGIYDQGVPAGVTIIKVDYDTNQELRKKYGVTIQTTFVKIDDQGELVSKYVAYDEPTFDAVKREYL